MIDLSKPWHRGGVALVVAGMIGAACQPGRPTPTAPTAEVAATPTRCTEGALACVKRAGTLVAGGHRGEAIALLRQVCVTDDEPLGCSALARTLLAERAPDLEAAAEVGERALTGWARRCQAEDWAACVYLGKDIDALAHDAENAFAAFDLACAHDQGDGCAEAGTYAQDGAGTPRDRAGAIQRYIRGCELMSATGCFYLGLALQDGQGTDVRLDETRAVASFAAACELGELRGCNNYGLALEEGRGIARDPAAAVKVYVAACDAGHGRACHNVGTAFEEGTGVAVDLRAAYAAYVRGCERGAGTACQRAGYLREMGIGVAVDLASAFQAYERACELDDPHGCGDVGRFYTFGKVGPKDEILGVRYSSKACALKDIDGCRATGFGYQVGRGVVRDNAKAAVAYLAACDLGDLPSCGDAGNAWLASDAAKALDPLARHCTSETPRFRESCRLLAFEYMPGTAVADPVRALEVAERGCLAPALPDEIDDSEAVVGACELALRALDALPRGPSVKARRAHLVEAQAAARAASAPPGGGR